LLRTRETGIRKILWKEKKGETNRLPEYKAGGKAESLNSEKEEKAGRVPVKRGLGERWDSNDLGGEGLEQTIGFRSKKTMGERRFIEGESGRPRTGTREKRKRGA